ncbi:MAG: AAA family ATPase [Bdellovibrionales bacterium]|nr:AAA family ATPase [Bdellovibrionales bacterium]
MYARLLKPKNDSSFFLFGPRGTGKTSWLKFHYKDAIYIDLLKSQIYNDLRVRPERLWDLIPRNYRGAVIIDEIQKLPPLLDEIHSVS